MEEGIFYKVAQFVEILVVFALNNTIFLWRYNWLHALFFSLLKNRICVVAAIGQQMLCREAFDQAASLRAIRRGTLCNNDSDRHTMRIHGQVYLGVEPPFVRLIS